MVTLKIISLFHNRTIKAKLNILFAVVIALSFSVTSFFVVGKAKDLFSEKITELLESQNKSIINKMESFNSVSSNLSEYLKIDAQQFFANELRTIEDMMDRIKSAYTIFGNGEQEAEFRYLDLIDKKKVRQNGFAFAYDMDGMAVVRPNKRFEKFKPAEIENFKKNKEGFFTLSTKKGEIFETAYKVLETFNIILFVSVPDNELNTSSSYIRKAALDSFITEVQNIKFGKTGQFFCIDSSGVVVVHPDKALIGKNIKSHDYINEIIKNKNGIIRYKKDGETYLASYRYIKDKNWILIGGAPLIEFVSDFTKTIEIQFIIIGLSVMILVMIMLRLLFSMSIMKPVENLGNYLKTVADGDLRNQYISRTQDELSIISNHINSTFSEIRKTLLDVDTATSEVAASAQQMDSSGLEMSEAIAKQAVRTKKVTEAINRMSEHFIIITEDLDLMNKEMHNIRSSVTERKDKLDHTAEGIHTLSKSVQETALSISDLGDSSNQIGEILQTINDIADQTNLLALNAAIEAARAGEHGRGFAVVADEVRKLAERTMKATHEIDEMIKSIQSNVKKSVDNMQKGVEASKNGEKMMIGLKDSLNSVINDVISSSDRISNIAESMEQQSNFSIQIKENVAEIADYSQNNKRIADENKSKSENLFKLADGLQKAVDKFKL